MTIKNILSSDELDDILNGINGVNEYVFNGKYGNDTVKTKGKDNTLKFDEGTAYYFTAKGNDLVMHTDSSMYRDENGELTESPTYEENNLALKDMYIVNGKLSETGTYSQKIGTKSVYEKDGVYNTSPTDPTYKIVGRYYYNGTFTSSSTHHENNLSITDMYLVDGELSEMGTEDQRIGNLDGDLMGVLEDTKISIRLSDACVDAMGKVLVSQYDGYEKIGDRTVSYVTSYDSYRGQSYISIVPDGTPGATTVDASNVYLSDAWAIYVGDSYFANVSYTPVELDLYYDKGGNTDRIWFSLVQFSGYTAFTSQNILQGMSYFEGCVNPLDNMNFFVSKPNNSSDVDAIYYNSATGQWTKDILASTDKPVDYARSLGSYCIDSDGYLSDSGQLIDNRPIYVSAEMFDGYSYGVHASFEKTYECQFLISNTKDYYVLNASGFGTVSSLNSIPLNMTRFYIDPDGEIIGNPYHYVPNKSISTMYLVDGKIQETGDPSQLIGSKSIYVKDGIYYDSNRDDSFTLVTEKYYHNGELTNDATHTVPNEWVDSSEGTVTIKNFLKGNIDVKVDIGDKTGMSLADMVKESYVLYDKSEAAKKQTIKAQANWNNKVIGSDYNDKIYGGKYNDELSGGKGNDIIYTNSGDDKVYGGDGNDTIYLNGKGTKTVDGGDGDDKIYLNSKNIQADITGGNGNDKIYIKKSVLEGTTLNFKEGSGADTVAITKGANVSGLTLNIENFGESSTFTKSGNNLIVTSGEDTVTLTNYFAKGYETYISQAQLSGKTLGEWVAGADRLYTTSNSKSVSGTKYNDYITTGTKTKTVSAKDGNDVIVSSYQKMTIDGGAGEDIVNLTSDNDYTVALNYTKSGSKKKGYNFDLDHNSSNLKVGTTDENGKTTYSMTLKNVEEVQMNGSELTSRETVVTGTKYDDTYNVSNFDFTQDKLVITDAKGNDTLNLLTNSSDYTVLFNISKSTEDGESAVGEALYVVGSNSTDVSKGISMSGVENVKINNEDYVLSDEIVASVQSWLQTANGGVGYDSVADAISQKCDLQELLALYTVNNNG